MRIGLWVRREYSSPGMAFWGLVECFGGEDEELRNLLREKIRETWRKWELDVTGGAVV
jgi:hypothetical protein